MRGLFFSLTMIMFNCLEYVSASGVLPSLVSGGLPLVARDLLRASFLGTESVGDVCCAKCQDKTVSRWRTELLSLRGLQAGREYWKSSRKWDCDCWHPVGLLLEGHLGLDLKKWEQGKCLCSKSSNTSEVVQRRCLAVGSEHDEQDLLGGNTGQCTREAPQMKLVPSDRLPGLLGSWNLI